MRERRKANPQTLVIFGVKNVGYKKCPHVSSPAVLSLPDILVSDDGMTEGNDVSIHFQVLFGRSRYRGEKHRCLLGDKM